MPKRPGPLAAGKDFKKRKAKVGKKAVKQANVTKVNVKSRQLHLPQQNLGSTLPPSTSSLAEANKKKTTKSSTSSTPTAITSRGQNLQSLLVLLRHYNADSRTAALHGLKELALANPSVANQELSSFLDGALDLLLDPEDEVRAAVIGLTRILLSGAERNALIPFVPLTATYLSSALTHLDQSIRRDALPYMDVLVQTLGSSLCPHVAEILPSLPSLLECPPRTSKRKAKGAAAAAAAGSNDKDQSQKARSEMWIARLAVLRSVLGLVRLLSSSTIAASRDEEPSGNHPLSAQGGHKLITYQWCSPSTASSCLNSNGLILLRRRPMQSQANEGSKSEMPSSPSPIGPSVLALLPRIKAYILEMTPGSKNEGRSTGEEGDDKMQQGSGDYHQLESGPLLLVLARTIDFTLTVLQRVKNEIAESADMRSLVDAIIGLFPARLADGSSSSSHQHAAADGGGDGVEEQKESSEVKANMDASEEGLNIGLVEVMIVYGKLKAGALNWLLSSITKASSLKQDGGLSDFGSRVVRLHRVLLMKLYGGSGQDKLGLKDSKQIAERVIACFEDCIEDWPLTSNNKRAAIRLLCDVSPLRPPSAAQAWLHQISTACLPSWSATAPTLCGSILKLLLAAARVTAGAAESPEATVGCLPRVVIALLNDACLKSLSKESRYLVLDLLFYCPKLTPALVEAIQVSLQSPGLLSSDEMGYLLEVLHHRRQSLSPSEYLGFLSSLLDLAALEDRNHAHALARSLIKSFQRIQSPALLPMLTPALQALLVQSSSVTQYAASLAITCLADNDAIALPESLVEPLVKVLASNNTADLGDQETESALLSKHQDQLLGPLVTYMLTQITQEGEGGASNVQQKEKEEILVSFRKLFQRFGLLWRQPSTKEALRKIRTWCQQHESSASISKEVVRDLDLIPGLGLGK